MKDRKGHIRDYLDSAREKTKKEKKGKEEACV